MERAPTAEDVKLAWANWRRPWDFRARPEVRIPLHQPMSIFDIVVPDAGEPPRPIPIRHAVVRIEYGRIDGRRACRLIGTVPQTNISVELETCLLD